VKDKARLTKEEAKEYERKIIAEREQFEATPIEQQSVNGRTGYNRQVWFERGLTLADARTSLIIQPQNGRLPPLTPQAQKLKEKQGKDTVSVDDLPADGPEDRLLFERCITRGMPGAMIPGFYNHNYNILQTPEYVVILVEMIHDARIIPLDGRPHVACTPQKRRPIETLRLGRQIARAMSVFAKSSPLNRRGSPAVRASA
jgi:hypothetical protein